jgi:hypothetical protein
MRSGAASSTTAPERALGDGLPICRWNRLLLDCQAHHRLGVKEEGDKIWLVSFMNYDIGYFDLGTCRVEPLDNPFGPKVLTMSPL